MEKHPNPDKAYWLWYALVSLAAAIGAVLMVVILGK